MFLLIRVCSLMDILAYYVVQEHLVVRWADLVDTWVAREVWMLATREGQGTHRYGAYGTEESQVQLTTRHKSIRQEPPDVSVEVEVPTKIKHSLFNN